MSNSTDKFDKTIWAIISADRNTHSHFGSLALQAAGLPPTGPVTLEHINNAGGGTAGEEAVAGNALMNPAQLWVTVPVAPNGPYYIVAYTTYGSDADAGLTSTAQAAQINVTAIAQGTSGQLWTLTVKDIVLVPKDGKKPEVCGEAYLIEGTDNAGAIKRSSAYPVPGVGVELGLLPDQDKHQRPYYYQMVPVPYPPGSGGGSGSGSSGSSSSGSSS